MGEKQGNIDSISKVNVNGPIVTGQETGFSRAIVPSTSDPLLLSTLATYVPALILKRTLATPSPITNACLDSFPAAVLFADISGFTALTEQLGQSGPSGIEALTAALNAYFEQLITLIHNYGGDIVKFAGDALLVIWPIPEFGGHSPATDSGLGAVTVKVAECGLAIQKMLHNYEVIPGTRLSLHVGIGAGEVFTLHVGGIFGRWEFLIAGAPLTQMSNAESLAQPGEVVLSPEAWALLETGLEAEFFRSGKRVARYNTEILSNNYRLLLEITEKSTNHDNLSINENLSENLDPNLLLSNLSPEIAELVARSLRAYIPAAILSRLVAGQIDWISELRRVTILFINLKDLDCNEPQALSKVQKVMQKIQNAIYRYEGSINKLLMDDKGTTLIAVFGLPPLAHEDDAIRGVQVALDIQLELNELSLSKFDDVTGISGWNGQTAIGVTTGRAFCGSVGSATRREYTTIGDVVNLSARLMKAAPNDILCDESTYQASRGRIKFEILPPILVKGKTDPVAIYRPQRGRWGEHLINAWDAGSDSVDINSLSNLPTIGRTKERLLLAQQVTSLWRGGQGGIVVIEGEAGIGKSRLVDDVRRLATSLGITSFVGMGNAIEKNISYNAWRNIFSQLLDLEILWNPQDRQRHVLNLLELEPELLPQVPLLNAILPLDLPETDSTAHLYGLSRAKATRSLLLELLQKSVGRSPKVIIIEDAQWLDSASWALTLAVSQFISHKLLVIAVRPTALDIPEYQQLLAENTVHKLELPPLSLEDTIALIYRRLGVTELPDAVSKLISDKSQGNPFFTEELAYALQEQGLLKKTVVKGVSYDQIKGNNDYNMMVNKNRNTSPISRRIRGDILGGIAADFSKITVPDTVEGVITSRIDRLTPTQQLILKVASVIGRIFELQTLYDIYPINIDKSIIDQALDSLTKLDIIHALLPNPEINPSEIVSIPILNIIIPPLTSSSSVPSYIFKHAIIQEVAYNLMAYAQRRQLHASIALWYEATYKDDLAKFYPVLAHHWTQSIPPNISSESEITQTLRAINYLEKAGNQAVQGFANAEAAHFFQTALKLLLTIPDSHERRSIELRLQTAIGLAVMAYKGWGAREVEAAYDRARELLNVQLPIVPLNSRSPENQKHPTLNSEEVLSLFTIMSGLWTFYQVRAQLGKAHSLGEQLLGLALRSQASNLVLQANLILGSTLIWQGELSAASLHFEQVIAFYNSDEHHCHAFLYGRDPGIFAHSNSALILWLLGYPDKAAESMEIAQELAKELEDPFGMAASLVLAAQFYQFCDKINLCKISVEQSILLSQEKGFPFWESTATILQGWIIASEAQLENNQPQAIRAMDQISQGLDQYWTTGAEIVQTYHLFLLALACSQAGEIEEGLRVLLVAQETAQQTGERFWEAELYRLQGELLLQGDPERLQQNFGQIEYSPENCFQQARSIAIRQGAKSLELRALISLAKLWQQEGKIIEAQELLGEVYHWFTEGFDTADLQEALALLEQLKLSSSS